MSGSGGSCFGIGSEASSALWRKQDLESARMQLHEEIELLEIMSARTSLCLLDLASIGDAFQMSLQDSADKVTVARLRYLGMEIEKVKMSTRELRMEILEAKQERIEVLDGVDGLLERHRVVHKHAGSHPRAKRPDRFNVMVVGMAMLVMALCVLVADTRGHNGRK